MNEIFKTRKLWNGFVSIPNFVVEYAKRNHRPIRVEYEGKYMLVTKDSQYQITAPPQTAQRTDKYIKKGNQYELFDYLWAPVEEVKEVEFTDEGRTKMLNAWKKLKAPKQMVLDKI
jgi:hypothetical protein